MEKALLCQLHPALLSGQHMKEHVSQLSKGTVNLYQPWLPAIMKERSQTEYNLEFQVRISGQDPESSKKGTFCEVLCRKNITEMPQNNTSFVIKGTFCQILQTAANF